MVCFSTEPIGRMVPLLLINVLLQRTIRFCMILKFPIKLEHSGITRICLPNTVMDYVELWLFTTLLILLNFYTMLMMVRFTVLIISVLNQSSDFLSYNRNHTVRLVSQSQFDSRWRRCPVRDSRSFRCDTSSDVQQTGRLIQH